MAIWERMKTKWGVMLIALLMMVMMTVTAGAASYPFTGVVTDDTNMRSTATSYASNVIRRIPEGDLLQVTGETGNFYRVEYDGRTGYVFKQYVEKSKNVSIESSGMTAAGYPYESKTTSSVNLRKSASTSAKKLDTIPKGAKITVLGLSGSWANVTYDGQTGWAMKDYIQVATIVTPSTPDTDTVVTPSDEMDGYELLQAGSDGDRVTALQEALIELGYLKGKADGKYGSATASAVMAFQKKNDLPVTGYADANLQALMFSGKPVNSSGKAVEIKTLPVLSGLSIRLGDKGVVVRTVQSVLYAKGYYTGTISGTYDNATVNAVKAFQKKNGLTADGVCGAQTQELLYGSGLASNATPTPKPTASPTPLPQLEKPVSTVRQGSKGDDAKLVQQRLIDLKYLTGKADGVFGTKSVAALKAFQEKNNLVADGVAGSGTNAVLFSWLCLGAEDEVYNPVVPSTPATPETEDETEITKDNVVLIKQGVTGAEVLRLQKRLEQLGYYTSSKDSKCEKDDVAAIRLFQQKNGLKVDGAAGYDTQVLLYSDSAIMYNGQLAGSLTMSYETLKKGMKGDAVKAMQERLIELNYLEGTADGVFGTDTAEAVYYFQKNNGLVRDSIAGEDTLRLLFSTSAKANEQQTSTPTVDVSADILRKGDQNDAVLAMQLKLISLGYLQGSADGMFGNLTYKALKEFQKANALYADGIAGKDTIEALNNAGTAKDPNTNPETTIDTMARKVKYEYWYSTVRNAARKHPYATLYDPDSGISWQVHMFSFGKHAEIEPLTPGDTEKMNQVCGVEKWTPKVVWVIFADGTIRIATTHSVPHGVQHRTDNNFPGHACLHFPRTMAQVTAIGPYATKHQNAVDKAWAELQASLD